MANHFSLTETVTICVEDKEFNMGAPSNIERIDEHDLKLIKTETITDWMISSASPVNKPSKPVIQPRFNSPRRKGARPD